MGRTSLVSPTRDPSRWSAATLQDHSLQIDASAHQHSLRSIPPPENSPGPTRPGEGSSCGRSILARRGCRSQRSACALRAVAAAAAGRHPRGHCRRCSGSRGGRKGIVYLVDELALAYEAGVEQETTKPQEAYRGFPKFERCRYRPGWLPD